MKFKKLVVLLAVLGVLTALGVIKVLNEKNQISKQAPAISEQSLQKDLAAAFVRKIILYRGDQPDKKTIFVKNDQGNWILESHFGARAKNWQVESLLKELVQMKGELRSDSKDALSDFQLQESQGLHIELLADEDKPFSHVIVSFLRPGGPRNFARIFSSHQVLVCSTDILAVLGLATPEASVNAKSFTDLQAIKMDVSKVSRVEIQDKGSTLVFTKKENVEDKSSAWQLEPADPKSDVDSGKVTSFFSGLTSIYAQEILDPKGNDYGFNEKSPWIRLLHRQADQPVQTELVLGKQEPTKKIYYLKVLPEGLVFEIPEDTIAVNKKDKAFFLKAKS